MVDKTVFFDGRKAVTLSDLDGFMDYLLQDSGQANVKDAFRTVSWLYRSVNVRANGVAAIPFEILSGDTVVDSSADYQNAVGFWPNPFEQLKQIEGALTLLGRCYLFNTYNRVRTLGLRYLLPTSIEPKIDETAGLTGWIRNLNGRRLPWPLEDVIYFWSFDPYVEFGPPKASPATAALAAAGVLMNVDQFAAEFAARGMIKATILRVPPGTSVKEKDRLKAWWQQVAGGIRNAWNTFVLNSEGVEPVTIGEGFDQLADTELTTEQRTNIAVALGVPSSILNSADIRGLGGGGVASQDVQNLMNWTIVPESQFIARELNRQVFNPMGYVYRPLPLTMDWAQEDEEQRASAWASYVSEGMPLSVASEMLGLDLPEGWEYADLDAYQEKRDQERAERQEQFAPKPSPEDEDEKEAKEDERRWRSISLRQLKAGRSAAYDFQSNYISPARHSQIHAALVTAITPEEVKAAFAARFPLAGVYP